MTRREEPEIAQIDLRKAAKDVAGFWPFLLRAGFLFGFNAAISRVIAEKDLSWLGAYAAYRSVNELTLGFLYFSIFPVVTLMSDAKRAEDVEKIRLVWRQGVIFSFCLSVPAIIFGLTASPIFSALKQPNIVIENSEQYLRFCTFGFVADIFYRFTARAVTGLGVKKSILIADAADHALETFFAYGFLNGKFGLPELGIAGVGLAYSVSKCITLFLHLLYIATSFHCFGFDYAQYHLFSLSGKFFDKTIFKKLVAAGIPDGLSGVVSRVSSALVVMFCGQSGTQSLVGLQLATVYDKFSIMHMSMIYNFACKEIGSYHSILTDQENKFSVEIKNKAIHNVNTYIKLLLATCFTISFIPFILVFAIPEQLAGLLIHQNNTEAQAHLEQAIPFLKVQGIFELISGVRVPAYCALDSFLDNRFLFLVSFVFELGVSAASAAVAHFKMHENAQWVYAASGAGMFLLMVSYLCRVGMKMREYHQNANTVPTRDFDEVETGSAVSIPTVTT